MLRRTRESERAPGFALHYLVRTQVLKSAAKGARDLKKRRLVIDVRGFHLCCLIVPDVCSEAIANAVWYAAREVRRRLRQKEQEQTGEAQAQNTVSGAIRPRLDTTRFDD